MRLLTTRIKCAAYDLTRFAYKIGWGELCKPFSPQLSLDESFQKSDTFCW